MIYDFVDQQNYLKLDVVTFFKVAFNNCFTLKKRLKKSLKIHKTIKAKWYLIYYQNKGFNRLI